MAVGFSNALQETGISIEGGKYSGFGMRRFQAI
jgi:hypothetical protein